jgi:hypothetical protein
MSAYTPDERPSGMSRAHYDKLYYNAWVDGPGAYGKNRKSGSEPMHDWFIEMDFMTEQEWIDHYTEL